MSIIMKESSLDKRNNYMFEFMDTPNEETHSSFEFFQEKVRKFYYANIGNYLFKHNPLYSDRSRQ
jgi:hypothetical protein